LADASDDANAEIEVPELCSEGREGDPDNGEDPTHDDERASASVRLKTDTRIRLSPEKSSPVAVICYKTRGNM